MGLYGLACLLALLPLPVGALVVVLSGRGRPWASSGRAPADPAAGGEPPFEITIARMLVPFWALFTLTLCVPTAGSVALDLGGAGRAMLVFPVLDAVVALAVLVAVARLARRATGAATFARRTAAATLAFHGGAIPLAVALLFAIAASTPGRAMNAEDAAGFALGVALLWALPGVLVGLVVRQAAIAAEAAGGTP